MTENDSDIYDLHALVEWTKSLRNAIHPSLVAGAVLRISVVRKIMLVPDARSIPDATTARASGQRWASNFVFIILLTAAIYKCKSRLTAPMSRELNAFDDRSGLSREMCGTSFMCSWRRKVLRDMHSSQQFHMFRKRTTPLSNSALPVSRTTERSCTGRSIIRAEGGYYHNGCMLLRADGPCRGPFHPLLPLKSFERQKKRATCTVKADLGNYVVACASRTKAVLVPFCRVTYMSDFFYGVPSEI